MKNSAKVRIPPQVFIIGSMVFFAGYIALSFLAANAAPYHPDGTCTIALLRTNKIITESSAIESVQASIQYGLYAWLVATIFTIVLLYWTVRNVSLGSKLSFSFLFKRRFIVTAVITELFIVAGAVVLYAYAYVGAGCG